MEVVMANPRVARNAYQRMYDMILLAPASTASTTKYVHYKLFDDPIDGGKDAVFGLVAR
jgi:serine protein kinase